MEPVRRKGRPRAFDANVVLQQAGDLFWRRGFSATSLDEVAASVSMKRPSLANAFGSKEAIYLLTLRRYRNEGAASLQQALRGERPLDVEVSDMFDRAIGQYLGEPADNRGCMLIGTASVESVDNPAIRQALAESLAEFEDILASRLGQARSNGELPEGADAASLAALGMAVLHSLAVRARAGANRPALEALARVGVTALCETS